MESKAKEAYKRNKKKLEYILGHEELNTILSKDNQKVVKKAFNLMTPDMCIFAKTGKPSKRKITGEDKSSVKEALNLLLNIVINAPMKPILKDLAFEFGLLTFNWNKVYGKRPDIAGVAVTIRNVVDKTLSLMESIDIIKGLTERVKSLERFAPPAFELSKHYLNSLEGK